MFGAHWKNKTRSEFTENSLFILYFQSKVVITALIIFILFIAGGIDSHFWCPFIFVCDCATIITSTERFLRVLSFKRNLVIRYRANFTVIFPKALRTFHDYGIISMWTVAVSARIMNFCLSYGWIFNWVATILGLFFPITFQAAVMGLFSLAICRTGFLLFTAVRQVFIISLIAWFVLFILVSSFFF